MDATVAMDLHSYLVFTVDDQFYALSVDAVKQIIRSVQLIFLPEAPEFLLGLINMGGEMIPVINIRKQFKVPGKSISLSDRIVIARTHFYTIAFIADQIESIIELPQSDITPSEDIFPRMEDYIIGTAQYNYHTVLIYDINSLFPETEIEKITRHLNYDKELA